MLVSKNHWLHALVANPVAAERRLNSVSSAPVKMRLVSESSESVKSRLHAAARRFARVASGVCALVATKCRRVRGSALVDTLVCPRTKFQFRFLGASQSAATARHAMVASGVCAVTATTCCHMCGSALADNPLALERDIPFQIPRSYAEHDNATSCTGDVQGVRCDSGTRTRDVT